MTSKVVPYYIAPTVQIPNSPKPLLLYRNRFLQDDGKVDIVRAYDTFEQNGWEVQWVTRYGHYQTSHYHPTTHEVMVVVSGPGIIRWGVADLDDDPHQHTYGKAYEGGGVQMTVNAGDVFVIPAGVAHKSFDPRADIPDPICLTGGEAHFIDSTDPRTTVAALEQSGFIMMGAYPRGCNWRSARGGEHVAKFETVWNVQRAELDPVMGRTGGINTYWKGRDVSL